MRLNFSLTAYRKLFWYFLISIAASILLSGLYLITSKLVGVDPVRGLYEDDVIRKYDLGAKILLTAIAIPILEELAYRAYLVYHPVNLAVSCGLIASLQILPEFDLYSENLHIKILTAVGVFLAVSATIFVFIKKDENRKELVKHFWINNSKLIFYVSIVIFAIVHLLTFGFVGKQFIFVPLFVLPYLVISYYLCRIRLELGLIWSIQLHMLINLVASLRYVFETQ